MVPRYVPLYSSGPTACVANKVGTFAVDCVVAVINTNVLEQLLPHAGSWLAEAIEPGGCIDKDWQVKAAENSTRLELEIAEPLLVQFMGLARPGGYTSLVGEDSNCVSRE